MCHLKIEVGIRLKLDCLLGQFAREKQGVTEKKSGGVVGEG